MKILTILWCGLKNSVRAWKGVLIFWVVSFFIVCLVASPMKSALSAGFGNSTITDQLKNGINIEVLADLSATLTSLSTYFSKGLMLIILIWFVVSSFLNGGLFNSLRNTSGKFSTQEFFRVSAGKFWAVFFISLILCLLILALLAFILIIPVSVLSASGNISEVFVINVAMLLSSLFLFLLIFLLISADYARAWQVANEKNAPFKAVNFGFRQTFRTFFSSYPAMMIVIIIQILFMWLVMKILHGINPQSEPGLIFLFFVSQILFFMKLILKTWRYGCMTMLMESAGPPAKIISIPDIDNVQDYDI